MPSYTEETDPQPRNAASAAPGSDETGHEEDDDEDGMIAMMTASLERELAEMRSAEHLAAEKEPAESVRREVVLEKQLRVPEEMAALTTQNDPTENISWTNVAQGVARHGNSADELSRADLGSPCDGSAKATSGVAWGNSPRDMQAPEPIPNTATGPSEYGSSSRVSSTGDDPMRITDGLPRLYHQADMVDWSLLMERISLTTNLNLENCYRRLGLDLVRGQELSNALKDYLRTPGNSVNIPRKAVATRQAQEIIAQLAHKLLCEHLWGQNYFNRPHLECGCSNVSFETDSTWIFLEFSRLLYKTVKMEERRKKAQLASQQKRDARNAVQHPVASTFASAPAEYASPRILQQRGAPQHVSAQVISAPASNIPRP